MATEEPDLPPDEDQRRAPEGERDRDRYDPPATPPTDADRPRVEDPLDAPDKKDVHRAVKLRDMQRCGRTERSRTFPASSEQIERHEMRQSHRNIRGGEAGVVVTAVHGSEFERRRSDNVIG